MNEQELKNYFDDNYKNIDQFLIDNGVPKKHLDLIRNEKIKAPDYPKCCYDEVEVLNNILIPVEKVVKTTREGVINREWYQIVKESFLTCTTYKNANITPKRILNCFSFLFDLGWEKWNESFKNKNVANFKFYSYEDQDGIHVEYHQVGGNGGGSHRLIAAKVGGVENMLAKTVYRHAFNPYKYNLYIKIKDYESKLKNKIHESDYFNLDDDKQNLICECLDVYYNYDLGEIFEEMFDTYYEKNIERVEKYVFKLQQSHEVITKIENILASRYNYYIWFPKLSLKRKLEKNNFIDIEMLIECENYELEYFIHEVCKQFHFIKAYNQKLKNIKLK